MAKVIKYIGRTTDFKGKTLWEIVGNLKDFGVGRIVIRNMFQRYKEPCFMKIVKVEAQPDDQDASKLEFRKVKVLVEKVFRGVKYPEPVPILRASYKADYQLIPKHLESQFTSQKVIDAEDKRNQKVLPSHAEYPPLLKRFLVKETGNKNIKMRLKYVEAEDTFYRVAKDGETPTVSFDNTIGKNPNSSMYKNIHVE